MIKGPTLGIETERKFLVRGGWQESGAGTHIRQGYLPSLSGLTLRVRWTPDGGTVTVKTPALSGSRWEAEWPIPGQAALTLLSACPHTPVEKIRHFHPHEGLVWEIDRFLGRHAGLVLAEVELTAPGQTVALPDWVTHEVTGIPAFHNSVIAWTASADEVLNSWRAAVERDQAGASRDASAIGEGRKNPRKM